MDNLQSNQRKWKTWQIILIVLIAIIAIATIARYTFLRSKFDDWGAGLQRIEEWQTEYKKQNPNATKEEMNAAFREGISNIEKWKEDYKAKNPGATDADADAVLNALWNK